LFSILFQPLNMSQL